MKAATYNSKWSKFLKEAPIRAGVPASSRAELPQSLISILSMKRPHKSAGDEALVAKILEATGGTRDLHGNVWVVTDPTSRTLFTCHTDTVHHGNEPDQTVMYDVTTKELFVNDDVLGADDGAGVWLLLEMIAAKIPGTYVFYRGEERGGIGSRGSAHDDAARYATYDRAIAFDRRGTKDVITHQGGGRCCSDSFAAALAACLSVEGMTYAPDDSGVFTDTANLTDLVGECTNVSCGYDCEHSSSESLSVPHLLALRNACLTAEWESLPCVRKPGEDDPVWSSYSGWYGRANSAYNSTKQSSLYDDVVTVADLYTMGTDELDEFVYGNPTRATELIQQLLDASAETAYYEEPVQDNDVPLIKKWNEIKGCAADQGYKASATHSYLVVRDTRGRVIHASKTVDAVNRFLTGRAT